MQASHRVETDVVLLGAGHAHLEVLRRFAVRPEAGIRLTLISREPETPYSGMLPGLIRGEYSFRQAHVDLAPLTAAASARLIIAEASAIDLDASCVAIPDRPAVDFDLLSVNVGGTPAIPSSAGIGVKPIGRFVDRLHGLETELSPEARIAVVGGGDAGVELTLALAVRFSRRFRLVLVASGAEPCASAPSLARRVVRQSLVDAGVEVVCGVAATGLQDGRLALSDGSFLDVAAALWATGVEGPEFLAASGLACDTRGCVRVDAALRSVSHPHVFAAGDCATLDGDERPKAGVWAVRAGAVLAENLRRVARRQPPSPWRPQRNALVMLGLGAGKAVAWRNGIAIQGHKVSLLKDRIDRRSIRRYTEVQVAGSYTPRQSCGAAEFAAHEMSRLLHNSDWGDVPDIRIAPDHASVLKPPAGKLLVQSVGQLSACLDDPFVFGQIAAAHALSDLYAMGALPWTALAIATARSATRDKMATELATMLAGAAEVLDGDGCALLAGHYKEAAETALGLSVNGLLDSWKVLRRSGLQPGDRLILTKKLGTGLILAGHARGQTRVQWLLAAVASMRSTNGAAARVAMAHRPSAGTSVAYSGLAGSLSQMLRASRVKAVLWREAIPALPGARALAAHDVAAAPAPHSPHVLAGLGAIPEVALLVDPQISGGLLLGLPQNRAETCLKALLEAEAEATIIGEIEPEEVGRDLIRLE
jgi:selenide,water dikinase